MRAEEKEADYADSFEKYRSQETEGVAALVQAVLRYVPSSPRARVVDIGCGPGRYALVLASATEARIFATDLSPAMIRKGKEKDDARGVSWFLSDACHLPFSDRSFDVILLFLVLHVVKDVKKAMEEGYRILRPGGHCFVLTRSHWQLDRETLFRFFPEARKLNKRRMPSLTRLKALAGEIGFHHLRAEAFTETVTYSCVAFLEKVRSKPNTSLRSMSDEDFRRGYTSLERAMAGQEKCIEETVSTLLTVEK
jgi:ubiquinone/menaquinone biosynthesis C-methylase UbiE